jgi:DeoR family fructose operon transcriptional repressor
VQLAPQLGNDYSFRLLAAHRQREKALIGSKAAELVQSAEVVFLDSGTTVLRLAEALALRLQTGALCELVVLTDSLTHLETLARWCKVILTGGEIRVERLDVCGSLAEANLAMFHVNRAFLGADAVSLKNGFMTTDERTSKMNQLVVERAEHVYVLVDSGKFDKSSFVQYASFSQVEAIYTDGGIGRETLHQFSEAGARIQIAR